MPGQGPGAEGPVEPSWNERVATSLQAMRAADSLEPYLDTLDGLVAATVARGWSTEQARALVAYVFGWRVDDTTPGAG